MEASRLHYFAVKEVVQKPSLSQYNSPYLVDVWCPRCSRDAWNTSSTAMFLLLVLIAKNVAKLYILSTSPRSGFPSKTFEATPSLQKKPAASKNDTWDLASTALGAMTFLWGDSQYHRQNYRNQQQGSFSKHLSQWQRFFVHKIIQNYRQKLHWIMYSPEK